MIFCTTSSCKPVYHRKAVKSSGCPGRVAPLKQSGLASLLRREITFFIHALREEGDARRLEQCASWAISIHALREEGDRSIAKPIPPAKPISIHALREEGDSEVGRGADDDNTFLSTPSARRATCSS